MGDDQHGKPFLYAEAPYRPPFVFSMARMEGRSQGSVTIYSDTLTVGGVEPTTRNLCACGAGCTDGVCTEEAHSC